MAVASIINPETFEVAFVMQNDAQGKAGQVVDMNGGHKVKRNDMKGMGGMAQAGNLGLLTVLGNAKTLTMCGEAVSYDDIRSREEQLKLDMVQAFGGEVAQMGEFIAEVMASLAEGSPLPEDQKDQLFEMVSEIVTLKNLMNTGALPEGQARLEAMIEQTATKIAETLLDGMDNAFMPAAIVDFVHGMLSNVGQQYDIPALNDALVKIEGRMNPENYLTNSVAEVIAQLTEMLESDDLSEEAQAEIESLIEKMEQAMEKGEPVPRDVMQALESLSENYPEISLKSEFTQAIETLKDANIVVKAEALGLSVAQVQEIETTIEKLEAQSQDLNEKAESKAELESLIESLQAFVDKGEPLTPEAASTIETIIESRTDWTSSGFESPSVETSSASTPSLSSIIASIAPSLATTSPSPAKPTAANSNESSAPTPETSSDTPVTQPEKPSDPVEIKAKESDPTPGENPSDPDPIDIGGGEEPDITKDDRDPHPDKIEKDEPTNEPESESELKQNLDAEPDPENPNQPIEDKKLDGNEPINDPETPSDLDQPEQKQDGNKGPCGEGICTCKKTFNDASRNKDGSVNLTLENGEKVQVSAEHAKEIIEKEITEHFQLNDNQWKDTLDQFNGDEVRAFEHLNDQKRQEADFSKNYVGPTTDFDNQPVVDAIAARMKKMKDSDIHICDDNCKHTFNDKTQKNTGHKSKEIDITILNVPQEDSGTVKKTKKKKKTKTLKNTP